jgi:acetoacetate decarboxylase
MVGIKASDIVQAGFSTPADAPLVPPFPFSYRNAEILTLAYRTDIRAIETVLPEPLRPMTDVVLIHIYKMNDTDWLGKYTEANVMVSTLLPSGDVGGYSTHIYLSSDGGVAQGREVHGQPKKLAGIRLKSAGDAWVGRIKRNGIDVATGTLAYKQKRAQQSELLELFDFRLNVNLKAINNIDGSPAIRQLTARRLENFIMHECWSGPCTVELRKNVQAPVFRLPVVEDLRGFYWRADFDLVGGHVLHDYL